MSAYLQKAHNNIVVAEMLFNNGQKYSSAHPAYYSAFLSVKYVLAHLLSIDYTKQEEMTQGQESHKAIFEPALKAMATSDTATGVNYYEWYNQLRKMRRLADYKPDSIEVADLQCNLNMAKSFLNKVDANFKTV